jgi:transposase InsO family protein
VILDIYSRYVVGWMVATRESAALAKKLIAATCAKQGITRGQLSTHADRSSSMTSKPVALLLAGLGITQSDSRPHVSNDNPYSESQFKTLKYRPAFPARLPSIEAARAHCKDFLPWYNHEHCHGGLGRGAVPCVLLTWLPSVSRGRLFPLGECAPVLAAVKHSPLDGGCGPVWIKVSGSSRENGQGFWRRVAGGGSGK